MNHVLESITEEQRQSVNARVRSASWSSADIASVAEFAGVTLRTAQRWFTVSGQQRDLVPREVVGLSPRKVSEELGERTAIRLAVARLVTGGMTQDSAFTREGYVVTQTASTIGEAARFLLDVQEGAAEKFYHAAYNELSVALLAPGIYEMLISYNRIGKFDSSDPLIGNNWEEELEDRDESVANFDKDDDA